MYVRNKSHQLAKILPRLSAWPLSINIGQKHISERRSHFITRFRSAPPMWNESYVYERVGGPKWMFALIVALEHSPSVFIQLSWKPLPPSELPVAPTKLHTRESEWPGQDAFYPHLSLAPLHLIKQNKAGSKVKTREVPVHPKKQHRGVNLQPQGDSNWFKASWDLRAPNPHMRLQKLLRQWLNRDKKVFHFNLYWTLCISYFWHNLSSWNVHAVFLYLEKKICKWFSWPVEEKDQQCLQEMYQFGNCGSWHSYAIVFRLHICWCQSQYQKCIICTKWGWIYQT